MIPRVKFVRQDGNTGVVHPGGLGVLAIIAAASAGPLNEAASHNDPSLAKAEFSWGPLSEFAAYAMPETGSPSLLIRADVSTAGAYGSITQVGGTGAATAGATEPYDNFDVLITFSVADPFTVNVGTGGAFYTVSLNGGQTTGKPIALGTDNTILIADTNITIDLGMGTIIDGETLAFKRPISTNGDLPDSLEALRTTTSLFEGVMIDIPADSDTVGLVATWLEDMNLQGKFPTVFLTFRPMGATEPEADYQAAFALAFAETSCVDVVMCADEDDMVSIFRGIAQARPVALAVASRSMAVDVGVEPAEVGLGPLTGVTIADARGNSKHHNETKFPGLDDLRATTLRTVAGEEGVYITNTNLLSPSGSDYVFLPHARTMNLAASITWQVLTRQLSRGVTKDPKAGPLGQRYIADHAAILLEALVQTAIDPALKGKVDDMKFRISRTDDISSNAGAKLTCTLESVSLAYIKEFVVNVRFVKQIAAAAQ